MEHVQYIFIDTAKCSGTPYEFYFTIPMNFIQCEPDERIRVSLVKWTCRHDWYTIRAPNNTFEITTLGITSTFEIPEGNYTYTQFASKLASLLNASRTALGVVSGSIDVSYSSITSKLTFAFPNAIERTFTFPSKSKIFGMLSTTKTVLNTTLKSDVPLDLYDGDDVLYVYCEGLHTPSKSRTLIHSTESNAMDTRKNLIASMQINNVPYQTISYENDGQMFAHFVSDKKLFGMLHFQIRTMNDELASFLPNSHLVIRVDAIADSKQMQKDTLKAIKDLKEFQRLTFLSMHHEMMTPSNQISNK